MLHYINPIGNYKNKEVAEPLNLRYRSSTKPSSRHPQLTNTSIKQINALTFICRTQGLTNPCLLLY